MSDDILNEFGRDSSQPQKGRATVGGVDMGDKKDLAYSKPYGPTNQMRAAPGLGGENLGCCGTQGKY